MTRHAGWTLVAVVVAVYGNVIGNAFHYDDFHSLVHNTSIRDLSLLPRYFTETAHFSADAEKVMYRPLVVTSLALNHAVGDLDPAGYHVVNILLHLGCVLLLWRLVLRVEGDRRELALVAALLFAVHPVGSEPVNYISSRSETLAAVFLLAALYLTLWGGRWRWGSIVAFAGSLLSKASAAALPLLLLSWRGPWRQRLRHAAPALVMLFVYIVILGVSGLLPTSREEPVRSLGVQLATQWKAVSWYLQLLMMPVHQSVDPAFAEGAWSQAAVWLAMGMAVSLMAVILRAAGPARRWWLLWPVWAALPASAVPLNVLVNEHRIYLAAAGLFVGVALLLRRLPVSRPVTVCLLVVLSVLSVKRNQAWATELSLWSQAVATAPHSARGRVHLGMALRDDGRATEAREQFEVALQLDSALLPARTNLANTLYEEALASPAVSRNLLAEARSQYEAVLDVAPQNREALTNLGNVLQRLGEPAAARQAYERAVEHHPDYPDAYANLAQLLFEQQQPAQAIRLLNRVVVLEPDNAQAYRRLGDAQVGVRDFAAALESYRSACRLDPSDATSCYNLGEVLVGFAGQGGPASARYAQEALRVFEAIRASHGSYRRTDERLRQLRGTR